MSPEHNAARLQPGWYCLRPCVRACWPPAGPKTQWVPVIGPAHSDREIIGLDPKHWHVDSRLLRKRLRESRAYMFSPVFSIPISVVSPETQDRTSPRVWVKDLPSTDHPVESYLRMMRRRFQEYPPPYPCSSASEVPMWLPKLEAAYRDHLVVRDEPVGAGLLCPHRGASLDGLEIDPEHCVTCPLHGLRLESGKLKPLTGME